MEEREHEEKCSSFRATAFSSSAKAGCIAKVMAMGLESIIDFQEETVNNLCTIQSMTTHLPNLDKLLSHRYLRV